MNKAINQQDLTDIYKTIHSTKIEHTFFSSTYETFSTVDHMLGHKTSLSKFIRTEFMELNREQIREEYLENSQIMWKLNKTLLNNELQKRSKGKLAVVPLPHSIHKN